MERQILLEALKRVSPALGRGDLLPQLACLWFDRETVSAFDDNISIRTPLATELEGGVDGTLLTQAIDRTKVKEVEVKLSGSSVTFKSGKRSNLKLGIRSIDERTFEIPKAVDGTVLVVDREVFHTALKFCLQSIGHDVTHPEWCGVTFEAAGGDLKLYSGYSQVLVQATVKLKGKPKFKRAILHEKFCQQVLAYPDAKLEVHDDYALLYQDDDGGKRPAVNVFGRALASAGGLDLGDMVLIATDRAKAFVPMPDLTNMLNRASMFEGDHNNMQVSMVDTKQGNKIKMVSASGKGELVDYSAVIAEPHEEVEVATNAKHLRNGATLPSPDICIGADEIIIRTDNIIQVVSVGSV